MNHNSSSKSHIKINNNGSLLLSNLNITSLNGCPSTVPNNFSVDRNNNLTSLVGGPTVVGGYYSAEWCSLDSLTGIPNKIGGVLYLSNNLLTSLRDIRNLKEMNGEICVGSCPITSHILGVFFIKGCTSIYAYDVNNEFGAAAEIVNCHIKQGKSGLLPCTKELIEAGLDSFAQI
jgi:hypothetical protein